MIVDYLRLHGWPSNLVVFYGWPEMLSLGDVLPQAVVVVALLALTGVALVQGAVRRLSRRMGVRDAGADVQLRADRDGGGSGAADVSAADGARGPGRGRRPMRCAARVPGPTATRAGGDGRRCWRRSWPRSAWPRCAATPNTRRRSTLAQTVVERRPTAVAHHILGEQLGLAGRRAEAEAALRTAVSLGDSRARYQLAALLTEGQRFAEAADQLEAFIATAGVRQPMRWLDPPLLDVLTARLMLARIRAADGRWDEVAAQARVVLAVAPRHPEAQRLLGCGVFQHAAVARGDRHAARVPRRRGPATCGRAPTWAWRSSARDGWTTPSPSSGWPRRPIARIKARRLLGLALADRQALGR